MVGAKTPRLEQMSPLGLRMLAVTKPFVPLFRAADFILNTHHVTPSSRGASLFTNIGVRSIAAPLNAQGVQDELISESQAAVVQNHPIGITNSGVAGDAPSLMTSNTGTMTTDWIRAVLIAAG